MRNLDEEFENFFKQTEDESDQSMADLITSLMFSSMAMHIQHLRATKYSIHMALGAYYADVVGLIDALAESYQGKFGLISFAANSYSYDTDVAPIEYLTALEKKIAYLREQILSDSEIENEIDTIVSLINSTLYKLKFLD